MIFMTLYVALFPGNRNHKNGNKSFHLKLNTAEKLNNSKTQKCNAISYFQKQLYDKHKVEYYTIRVDKAVKKDESKLIDFRASQLLI